MQQFEEKDTPKLATLWKTQQWADVEFKSYADDNNPEEFHRFFDEYAHRSITDFQGTNLQESKNNQSVFLAHLLILHIRNKNIKHNADEINWAKQQFDGLKKTLMPPFTPKEAIKNYMKTSGFPIYFAATLGIFLYLNYSIFSNDNQRNSTPSNKIFNLALLTWCSVLSAFLITAIKEMLLPEEAHTHQFFSASLFWSIESIHPEIQTLFDYFDKEIRGKEEKIELSHQDEARTGNGNKSKID